VIVFLKILIFDLVPMRCMGTKNVQEATGHR
jgi:hypothetical protein